MKMNQGLAFVALAVSSLLTHSAFAQELVESVPEQVFSPVGFDDNDTSQVVLHGTFPSTCYKVGPNRFKVDVERHEILIRNQAYYYPDAQCARVVTDWTKTVDLGVLPAGKYTVIMDGPGGGKVGELPISVARSRNPDNFFYAPATDAVVRGLEVGGPAKLTLHGNFSVTCEYIKEVRLDYQPSHVIVVLPIVAEREGVPCAHTFLPIRFEKTVNLERRWSGPTLIHVRTVEGSSVNRVVQLN